MPLHPLFFLVPFSMSWEALLELVGLPLCPSTSTRMLGDTVEEIGVEPRSLV